MWELNVSVFGALFVTRGYTGRGRAVGDVLSGIGEFLMEFVQDASKKLL